MCNYIPSWHGDQFLHFKVNNLLTFPMNNVVWCLLFLLLPFFLHLVLLFYLTRNGRSFIVMIHWTLNEHFLNLILLELWVMGHFYKRVWNTWIDLIHKIYVDPFLPSISYHSRQINNNEFTNWKTENVLKIKCVHFDRFAILFRHSFSGLYSLREKWTEYVQHYMPLTYVYDNWLIRCQDIYQKCEPIIIILLFCDWNVHSNCVFIHTKDSS